MPENRVKRSLEISRKWGLLCALLTSPLFLLFAYLGDPARGRAAWVSAIAVILAAKFFWDLRGRIWFWVTLGALVCLHVPLLLFVRWPSQHLSYAALLPECLADFAIAWGIIKLVENVIEKSS
jgi:hypothetical protein